MLGCPPSSQVILPQFPLKALLPLMLRLCFLFKVMDGDHR